MQKLFSLPHQPYIPQSDADSVSSINNPFSSKEKIFSTNDQIFASKKENKGYKAGGARDLFMIDRISYLGKLLQHTDFRLGKTSTLTCYCNY